MKLLDYFETSERDDTQQKLEENRIKVVENLKKTNTEYVAERIAETIFDKPEVLEYTFSQDRAEYDELTFVFSHEEFAKLQKWFKVLAYVKNNCNQNWILLELVRLLNDGQIQIDYKTKTLYVLGDFFD